MSSQSATSATPSALDFEMFDFDNHYYESVDAFTRYAPRELGGRGVQWAKVNGKDRLLVGGKVNNYVVRPGFDPVAKPGILHDWYRGNPLKQTIREAFGELEPIRAEYRDRDARLAVMDAQGLAKIMLFPTLGVGLEAVMADDPDATHDVFHAFNRWLDDDWGFAYQDRIHAVPYIPMLDPVRAVAELKWALDTGAKAVNIRNAPVPIAGGLFRSPTDSAYDDFWRLAEESRVLVCTHAGSDGYDPLVHMWEPGEEHSLFRSPLRNVLLKGRAVSDFYGALVCHKIFERFDGLRLVSVENGASWIPGLLHRLADAHSRNPGYFDEDPVVSFNRHVWVTPFWEDDVESLKSEVPVEQIVFGSDWPHAEGTVRPVDFVADSLSWADEKTLRLVMRENALGLLNDTSSTQA
jgi:predicted TIM-barrel fold metal-dependent hydrolase